MWGVGVGSGVGVRGCEECLYILIFIDTVKVGGLILKV